MISALIKILDISYAENVQDYAYTCIIICATLISIQSQDCYINFYSETKIYAQFI